MIEIKVDANTRKRIHEEASQIGRLEGSLTKGVGNLTGAAGETLAHMLLGGERVGHRRFSHDIELENGLTVDVKTGTGTVRPKPHFVARVYAAEDQREKLATKCDVYYFMRLHVNRTTMWALGWLFADEFAQKATFHPMGSVNPLDGRLCRADEFVVPISELRDPREPITR